MHVRIGVYALRCIRHPFFHKTSKCDLIAVLSSYFVLFLNFSGTKNKKISPPRGVYADGKFLELHNDLLNTLLVSNSADFPTRSPVYSPSSADGKLFSRAARVNGIFMRSYFPNFFDHERRGT